MSIAERLQVSRRTVIRWSQAIEQHGNLDAYLEYYQQAKKGASLGPVPTGLDSRSVNVRRYRRLLSRAIEAVIEPITGGDDAWLTQTKQLELDIAN